MASKESIRRMYWRLAITVGAGTMFVLTMGPRGRIKNPIPHILPF